MRVGFCMVLAGTLVVSACRDAAEITSPETYSPRYHAIDEGTPDGDYSLYWFDIHRADDLLLTVAQRWDTGGDPWRTECPGNTGSHANGDPNFPGPEEMARAGGSGNFVIRTADGLSSGALTVQRACWFDEWNGPKGFPESAWVQGTALVDGVTTPFAVKLISNGFPDQGHLLQLDEAELYLDGVLIRHFRGEIHHEDGLTLNL